MVLNKKEKVLMDALYKLTSERTGQCLVTPIEILKSIPYKVQFREEDLEPVLDALSLDGYFTYEQATRKGDKVYLIALKEKGLAYEREKRQTKIKIWKRVATTILFALLGYLIKVIISAIIG